MIDKKHMKKMWVWDVGEIAESKKRYVLDISDSGEALAVDFGSKDDFEQGHKYSTKWWDCYREIKEPEWWAFEAGEMPIEYLNYPFRFKKKTSEYNTDFDGVFKLIAIDERGVHFAFYDTMGIFQKYRKIYRDCFNSCEVYKDNKWQPVGIKK